MENEIQLASTKRAVHPSTNVMSLIHGELCKGLVDVAEIADITVDSFFADQAVLLEGVSGVGKTKIAKRMAGAIGGVEYYGRIQGLAEVQPSDILAVEVYNPHTQEFTVRKKEIFKNIVLVDEINRLHPNTQGALHQAMEEGQVTVGEQTLCLPDINLVIATQNPHFLGAGTYPMTPALTDRFGVSLFIPNHTAEQTTRIGEAYATGQTDQKVRKIINLEDVAYHRSEVKQVVVDPRAIKLASAALHNIANNEGVHNMLLGARSIMAAIAISRARALRRNRLAVDSDIMAEVIPLVARHRFDTDSADNEGARQEIIKAAITLAKSA